MVIPQVGNERTRVELREDVLDQEWLLDVLRELGVEDGFLNDRSMSAGFACNFDDMGGSRTYVG